MTKRSGFWPVLALTAALAGPALAEGETADTVVATVNGTKITLGHMIALRESLPPEYQQLPDDVLFKGIYEQLIQQEVLAQSVKDLTPRAKATIENDRRGLVSGIAIDGIVKEAVTDAALQAAYDARFKDAKPQTEYNAAHILVETEEEAKAIKAELDAGADFAELAKAKSTDTGSGANGGNLGWFGLGMMVKPFEDAVVAAKVGEVTGPVQSEFGWHLILVKETRVAEKPTLDQMRDELAAEVENKAISARVEELTKGATVTREGEALDPALLKKAELID
ncbi:peptidylprolyl isomerase [Tabrizicola thermarum]|uniref:peptidylprolyl isomerase n=1 Tax=Tabrizicola thermarum TaxID=2670345 RepID=UPI000FFB0BD4|nr:peptidylprolyl isomerase [Tabrizicola thermarum]